MNTLIHLIRKEFIQIFRNRSMLPLITVAPIMQLIVLSYAANNEVRDVRLAIVDHDHSVESRALVGKIRFSDRFVLVDMPPSDGQADELLQSGEIDIALSVPPDFGRDLLQKRHAPLQMLVNAINGQQATVGAAYLQAIVQAYSQQVAGAPSVQLRRAGTVSRIGVTSSNWYNPDLNFQVFMAPGIMGELVTILVMLLTAMNIVREREIGTIEQINVTPIRKWQFITGKQIPFLLIGLGLLTVGLTAGKILFDVPMRGNLLIVFAYCVINLMAVLGLGFFISNLADTQQQALFMTFFFVIIFILMSGLFTPIESMPQWAQYLTVPNPIAHFVHVMRSVLLKGSGFGDVAFNFAATAGLAVVTNFLAVWSYRKVG